MRHLRMRRELSYLKAREETGGHLSEILGESPPIRELRRQIERIAALAEDSGVRIVTEMGSSARLPSRRE